MVNLRGGAAWLFPGGGPGTMSPPRQWFPLRAFVAGALTLLPMAGTALVLWFAVSFVYDWVGPSSRLGGLLGKAGVGLGASDLLGYLIGVGAVVMVIFCTGLLVELGLRRWLTGLSDSLMGRIPIVRTVYETMGNFVSMLAKSGSDSTRGMTPVWCRFGGENGAMVLGLLSCPEVIRIGGEDFMAVIIPTAPVPIGGGLFFLPAGQVRPAEGVGIEGLTSIYVSMGVTAPQFLRRGTGGGSGAGVGGDSGPGAESGG